MTLRGSSVLKKYYLREVILRTPATRGPVGARQRLPRTVHTRTDSTSSHTAAHHHSSSHFPTLHTCIPSISYPAKSIRWPCSDSHTEALRRAFRGAIARLAGSLAACQCVMPLVFIAIQCVTRKPAWQQLQWHWHADGEVDGLLRRRRLEQHIHGCRAPLRGSLATSRTAL